MTLITDEYRAILAKEHSEQEGQPWGQTAKRMVPEIQKFADRVNATGLLDYGAGHGGLRKELASKRSQLVVEEYEPGRPEAASKPKPNKFVVCIDVLEHIEPELIDNVLDDLMRVTIEHGYFTISCRPATKILSDGRNAHLIVENHGWWRNKLITRFNLLEESYDNTSKNYRVFVRNKSIP